MSSLVDAKVAVVVPNWNGADSLAACLDSLLDQTIKTHIIVVENGSTDDSVELLESKYPTVEVIKHKVNKGFAGGVNAGIRSATKEKFKYVALFNNDAIADKNWLELLTEYLQAHPEAGIATSKIMNQDGSHLDSTGDYYTVWGLPYPRGRGEKSLNKYDEQVAIFAASGGASLYRTTMLEEIGLFDEDFFAYYEDVDISFRAQLAGWNVAYVPKAVVYHQISATSSKIKGFATYQTMKNLQLLYIKNVPKKYLWRVGWRFTLAHTLFLLRAFTRRQGWSALKGDLRGTYLMSSAWKKRRQIQKSRTASDDYIWSMLVHDLPPNAHSLRKLRGVWWKLLRKREA
jgi:hypothetical protein